MESKSNSKNKARLIVMIVFVIGFAAGALSLNLYQRLAPSKDVKAKEAEIELTGNDYIINEMNKKLSLNEDQQGKIRAVLEERNQRFGEIRDKMKDVVKPFEPQFEAVRQESRDKIRSLLTEEQQAKYAELLKEKDRQREQMREKHKERR